MKTVLITGVAGLLGTHLSRYLLDKGYDVVGIDNLSGGYKEFVDDRIILNQKFHCIDLLDDQILDNIFNEYKIDYVFHFAAYAAEGLSPFIRNFNYTNNVLCSINVINKCIKYNIKKIIFTSSMATYGFGNPPFTEDQLPSPIDPYGIAKYTVEQDLKSAHDQFGLEYTIIRPHNVLGIYQNIWDKYRNVIGIWIRNVLTNNPILIYGDGEQKRAFSDIKYYLEPFEKVMFDFNGEIFNVGSDREYKLLDIANIVKNIGEKYGYQSIIEFKEPRHEVKFAYCNHDKAKKSLGLDDQTEIEDLVENMFVWAKDQPNRDVKRMIYEIEKNIYSYWR